MLVGKNIIMIKSVFYRHKIMKLVEMLFVF